jgi:hypothetical protein
MSIDIQEILVLKGHGFSRAAKQPQNPGLEPLRDDFEVFDTSLGG